MRKTLIWAGLILALAVPLVAAGFSPLLAWREPVYIVAGFAGVLGLAVMLVQPLLAGGYLPGLPALRGRRVHRWTGAVLVTSVLVHVVGLWITSPPDVVDVLLLRSPTPFSIWGLAAMWAVVLVALMVLLRKRLGLRPMTWRRVHAALAVVIVVGTVVHALLIEGTMEFLSKVGLCALVTLATAKVMSDLRLWAAKPRREP